MQDQFLNKDDEVMETTKNTTNEHDSADDTASSEILTEEVPHDMNLDLMDQMKSTIEELTSKLQRQMAENENIRARSRKMVEEAKSYAIFDFCRDLVAVLENLKRALAHADADVNPAVQNLALGIQMTKAELESVFTKYGVEAINPAVGDKFDYNVHYALSQVVTEQHIPGTIADVMQTGYKLKDRVITPAAVSVFRTEIEKNNINT